MGLISALNEVFVKELKGRGGFGVGFSATWPISLEGGLGVDFRHDRQSSGTLDDFMSS